MNARQLKQGRQQAHSCLSVLVSGLYAKDARPSYLHKMVVRSIKIFVQFNN